MRARVFFFPLVAALLITGCMTRPPAPVIERAPMGRVQAPPSPTAVLQPAPEPDWRPQIYTVKRGDTLYQIALDHGLDYRDLVAWNNIENPNLIRVGQLLMLSAPGAAPAAEGVTTAPLRSAPPIGVTTTEGKPSPAVPATIAPATSGRGNTPQYKTEPRAVKLAYSEQTLTQLLHAPATPPPSPPEARATVAPPPVTAPPASVAPPPTPHPARVPEVDDDKLDWTWPVTGKIVSGFSETANLKGIDIAGKLGQPVVAGAAGKVVYAGTGLRGYGKLIIVKHNSTFLSAYAHNKDILVKEGQQVAKGQQIAEMGSTDADQVKLHFEIRRLGKPVDPMKFLPPA